MISKNDGGTDTNLIPASQRPDGSWRKPRRVKKGYVPQEEVPLYESKGKQFVNRSRSGAAGTRDQVVISASGMALIPHPTIPGLFLEQSGPPAASKRAARKPAGPAVEDVRKSLAESRISPASQPAEPPKRLKNLRKRLREIEALEQKIQAGLIRNPDKDQLDKITRKTLILQEIQTLEM